LEARRLGGLEEERRPDVAVGRYGDVEPTTGGSVENQLSLQASKPPSLHA